MRIRTIAIGAVGIVFQLGVLAVDVLTPPRDAGYGAAVVAVLIAVQAAAQVAILIRAADWELVFARFDELADTADRRAMLRDLQARV